MNIDTISIRSFSAAGRNSREYSYSAIYNFLQPVVHLVGRKGFGSAKPLSLCLKQLFSQVKHFLTVLIVFKAHYYKVAFAILGEVDRLLLPFGVVTITFSD